MIEQSPAAISRARCSRRDELRSSKRMRSIVHLLHAIDMNFSDRESAALRTDLKFMIDAVAYPVVPATANPKTFKPDGSTTQ
ncbi:hypothetical protein T4B_8166 [Trichinella pseudospiralis]|uniref:Uncharacterized protein n=1 Tax=Trichinella pseudospiralis TaxID=6337 RepID=A0A0V1GT79_TRIPS|nr:hypothetical protein T4B_8166 [Trichinella pseudospiralis]